MRLLHILEAMGGGTRRHVLDLLPALVQSGCEVALAVSPRRNWPERETFARDRAWLELHGVRVHCIEMPRGLAGGGLAVRELSALIRNEQPDIIHCHSTVAGALGRLAILSNPRIPLVYTPHCIAFDTGLPRLQRRAARWIELCLAPIATRYIAVSQAEQRSIARVLHRRATLIYNGIDLKSFDAIEAQNRICWKLAESDFVIGCFGRLCAQKNQTALVQALATVKNEIPQAKLLLVGDGEDREKLERLVRQRRLGESVIFTGEFAEVRDLYALCDIVAQPSRWEGCPYSVLEAMAARKRVIARRVGGNGEILSGYAGHTYRSNDMLAPLLIAAARDESECSKDDGAARARIEERFTLLHMVKQVKAVYSQIL